MPSQPPSPSPHPLNGVSIYTPSQGISSPYTSNTQILSNQILSNQTPSIQTPSTQTLSTKTPNPSTSSTDRDNPSPATGVPPVAAYHHQANHNQNRTIEQVGVKQHSEVTSFAPRSMNGDIASADGRMTQAVTAPKVGFVSLGCPKALVDSERIITELTREGYQIAADYEGADVVVVNTCGFIESAVQESLDAIGEAINNNGKVIVTGCLGKDAQKIRDMHPAVLAVTGAHAYHDVIVAVAQHAPMPRALKDKKQFDPKIDLIDAAGIKLTPSHYGYLKISEGCNHRCTFCIIPSLRGDLVSRPIDSVMNEAMALKKAGVKELLVISQDTSAYGLDLKYKTAFWNGMPLKSKFFDLCQAFATIGIWVRLHYVYPYPHVDKVVELMATPTDKGGLLPYLDIPLQHASPSVLKAMKRPAHSENTLARIQKWRDINPDIVIRSTFVVGFPGETEDDFTYLLEWLQLAQLDRVGCFTYSDVEGAVANALPNPVPEAIKKQRYEQFMAVQQQISAQKLAAKVGKLMTVLVDDIDLEDNIAICRSYADAPEIDGHVYVDNIQVAGVLAVAVGDFITVIIDEASEYDLFASYTG